MQLIRLPDELRLAILALTSPLTKEQSKGAVVIMKHVEAELQGFSVCWDMGNRAAYDVLMGCFPLLFSLFSFVMLALSYLSFEREV